MCHFSVGHPGHCLFLDTASVRMESFRNIFTGAGFIPVLNAVNLENMRLNSYKSAGFKSQFLIDDSGSEKITLIYFWEPSCENCKLSLGQLDTIAASKSYKNITFQFVAIQDSDLSQAKQTFAQMHLKSNFLWDELGAAAERLAVFGVPGAVVAGSNGDILARVNGDVAPDTPGFDVLIKSLDSMAQQGAGRTIHQAMLSELPVNKDSLQEISVSSLVLGSLFLCLVMTLAVVFVVTIFRHRKLLMGE